MFKYLCFFCLKNMKFSCIKLSSDLVFFFWRFKPFLILDKNIYIIIVEKFFVSNQDKVSSLYLRTKIKYIKKKNSLVKIFFWENNM